MKVPQRIIICRTDFIGDVILSLPVAGYLKQKFPGVSIAWLGQESTRDIVACCEHVDHFFTRQEFLEKEIEFEEGKPDMIIHLKPEKDIAKRAKVLNITYRVGTSRRFFLFRTCNKLTWLKRKNSGLHEAQLNLKLLKAIGLEADLNIETIVSLYGFNNIPTLAPDFNNIIDNNRYNIIIHPKSRGSAREWPLEHFAALINLLPENRFNVILSGIKSEADDIEKIISMVNRPVQNIAGTLSLKQFIALIAQSDMLIANSTGPVHIAAASGIDAIGLYPPMPGLDPVRWKPLGLHSFVFVNDKPGCMDCKKTKHHCNCMWAIEPVIVAEKIFKLVGKNQIPAG